MEGSLDDLAARLHCRGWKFCVTRDAGHEWFRVGLVEPPDDNRHPGRRLDDFSDGFLVSPDWDERRIIERVFVTLQFLIDHELREQFTLDGMRVFEAHDPSVTGEQHDWFVERKSALRGY